ncbi:MAG: hypothetical protein J6K31_11705 [Parabacteroides sp.]|nr:hypothetical protein [Parabacteroides sp.]
MPKILYKDIPVDFGVCQHEDCPRAAACLHQIAYKPLLEQCYVLRLMNPNRCTKDDQCPHYRSSVPITYAWGFTGMQKRMFPGQYYTFMSILKNQFGHNPYYERRRGEFALPPQEQKFILDALRRAGVTEEMKFDRYEECINWFD